VRDWPAVLLLYHDQDQAMDYSADMARLVIKLLKCKKYNLQQAWGDNFTSDPQKPFKLSTTNDNSTNGKGSIIIFICINIEFATGWTRWLPGNDALLSGVKRILHFENINNISDNTLVNNLSTKTITANLTGQYGERFKERLNFIQSFHSNIKNTS